MPWLNSLKQECENNGTPILSKIIRSIIKKKSYVKFPQRQKREYIEKLLVVNDIGVRGFNISSIYSKLLDLFSTRKNSI